MEKGKIGREIIDWVKTLGIAVVCIWLVHLYIMKPVDVQGESMMPTVEDGDRVIVNKIGKRFTDYKRFDVIVFEAHEDTNYIKRIIGLPGDEIEYRDDKLYVNGEEQEESYLEEYRSKVNDGENLTEDFKMEEYLGESIVPEGSYFVLGDNRGRSRDSRDITVGFVSEEKIMGEVEVLIYPIQKVKVVK